MSYINRLMMATSVGVVNSQSEQGQKLKTALKSLNHGKKRFFSGNSAGGHGPDAADLRPLFAVMHTDMDGVRHRVYDQRKQADESLRQVIYLNSWSQG